MLKTDLFITFEQIYEGNKEILYLPLNSGRRNIGLYIIVNALKGDGSITLAAIILRKSKERKNKVSKKITKWHSNQIALFTGEMLTIESWE